MIYKSKVAWWLYLTLAICISPVFILAFTENDFGWAFVINLLICGGVSFFILYLTWTTVYIIKEDTLHIKSGFLINKKVAIDTIKKIKETNNPLSAPALSLDRLMITATNSNVLISPKEKSKFIAHLLKINPKIKVVYKN